MNSTMRTTFPVSDVASATTATTPLTEVPYKEAVEVLLMADSLEQSGDEDIFVRSTGLDRSLSPRLLEACARYHGHLISGVSFHPFVAAVHRAFMDHRPPCLSPDAVWLMICQGVANHVNAHAEELRQLFVSHEGKVRINVRRDDFVKGSPENPWPEVIDELCGQVREHVGPSIELFLPAFTTTGPVERVAAGVVLLDAMRTYFNYDLDSFCGIPSITLEGTPEDWQCVADRAEQFGSLGLEWWLGPLREILKQFVAAAQGVVDHLFWRSFYKHLDESGGPVITGWLSTFFPYLKDRRTGEVTRRNSWLSLDSQKYYGTDVDDDDLDVDDFDDDDTGEEDDGLDSQVNKLDDLEAPGRDDTEDPTVVGPRKRSAPLIRRPTNKPPKVASDQEDDLSHLEEDLDDDLEDDHDEEEERALKYEQMMRVWLNPIPRRDRSEDLDQDRGRDDPKFDCGPSLADLPSGLSKAPFRWQYLDQSFDMELLGGFVGVAQDRETLAVKPEIGWAVREAHTAP